MVWLILGLVILFILCWLLISPFEICINSAKNDYHIKWKGIGEAKILILPMDLLFRLRIAFWKKDWSVMEFKLKKDKKAKEKKPKKKKKKRDTRKMLRLGKRALGSFQVEKMRVNIDTRNYILNGYLFPIFFNITHFFKGKPNLSINYKGKTEINVLVRNRLINMLFALAKRS
ncbi:MAG: hypothetical protein DWQ02_22700 [Bacteroidetes bacterium]|nr:MAG: hypothetical protein DWQ02_22700 [Bacteroidota bacterium]